MSALIWTLGFVALAGIGAVIRWWFSARFNGFEPYRSMPWGTIGVNVTASFLLGVLHRFDGASAALVGAAFCGSLSTFSTFVLELVKLYENDRRLMAFGCLVISVGLGVTAAWLGVTVAS